MGDGDGMVGATWKELALKLSPGYAVRGWWTLHVALWVVQEKTKPSLILEGWMGEERVPWRVGGHTPSFPSCAG